MGNTRPPQFVAEPQIPCNLWGTPNLLQRVEEAKMSYEVKKNAEAVPSRWLYVHCVRDDVTI